MECSIFPQRWTADRTFLNDARIDPILQWVRLVVFDLLGREAAVLVNETKGAGKYSVTFDGTRLPRGTYICCLVLSGRVRSPTLLLLKYRVPMSWLSWEGESGRYFQKKCPEGSTASSEV